MKSIATEYKNWKYKNTAFLILSFILLLLFVGTPLVQSFISQIASLGYFGIFITGMFFVSTFTVAPAAVVLYDLSWQFNPIIVSVVAGAGGALGDLIIIRFLKDRVFEELRPLFSRIAGKRVLNFFKTPYFGWFAPLVGIVIIASPFPDEIGIGLLGVSRLKNWQFFFISFIANSVGIFLIISAVKSI